MRNSMRLAMGLAMLSFLASCKEGAESEGSEFTAKDSAAVAATVQKWVTTTLSRDFDAWGTVVTTDVIINAPNTAPLVGRDAAVAFAKTYPVITAFTSTLDEVSGHGGDAVGRGSFALTVKLPDGKTASDKGPFIGAFRRQPDGSWQYRRVIWNSSLPLPAAPPPPPKKGAK